MTTWTQIAKHTSTFINRAKNFLYYFWGTDDDKYVVDHNEKKIIFFDNSFQQGTKHESTYSLRDKN